MNKKVSVIVPVYNMANLLEKCLDSLKFQTYQNIEVIVVDDGSTDSSGEIADRYEKEDTRFKIFHHEINKGIACGIKTGINNSSGTYVTFVDSDNYISENLIERLVELKETTNSDIAQGNAYCYVDENELKRKLDIETRILVLENQSEIIEDYLQNKNITNNLSVKLFNKSWFDVVEIPEGRQVIDITTMLQMVGMCKRYVCTNEYLYYAYMAPNSISRGEVGERRISDSLYANEFYKKYINNHWPMYLDFINYRSASTAIWLYTMVKRSTKIETEKKKQFLQKFHTDFKANYKTAINTRYYKEISKKTKIIWMLFFYNLTLYDLLR